MSQLDENQKVTVVVRVRPKLDKASERYQVGCIQKINDGEDKALIINQSEGKEVKTISFSFDRVFDQDSTQFEFYQESCLDLVDSALQGCDATIFTYGQTGSGKTWTVLGRVGSGKAGEDILTPESGLFLRILSDLFKFKNQSTQVEVHISVSILEIYLEEFRDLLADSKDKSKTVTLRETDNDVQIQNLTVESVNSIDEVYKLYKSAEKNRIVSSTSMNDVSSRSHCAFLLDIVQMDKADPNNVLKSRICLVDLAGSERVKKSEVEGVHMKEAQAINKSLAALGNVVNGLYTDKKHIPFRDSKLTRILKPSFVGKGRVLLIANLSPTQSSSSESVSTLRFANRVKEMKTPILSDDQLGHQKEQEFIDLMKKNERLCAQASIAQKVFGYELQFENDNFIDIHSSTIETKIKDALKGYGSVIKKSQENEEDHKKRLLDSEIKKLTLEKSEQWQSKVGEVERRVSQKKILIEEKNKEILEARRQFEINIKLEEAVAYELEVLLNTKQREYEDMNKTVQELLIRKVELENAVVEKHAIYKEKIEDHEREWKKEELLMTIETQKHEILRRLYDEVYALRTQQVAYVNAKKRFEERWKQRDESLDVLTHYEMTSYIREAVIKLCEDAVDISMKTSSNTDQQAVAFGAIPSVSVVDVLTQISPRSRSNEKEIIPVQKPFTEISEEDTQDILKKVYPYDRQNILALVINYLKSGSVMKIHSKTRPPRQFLFTISEDLRSLCWKDDNYAEMEHVTVYTLPLYSIKAITLGQYSETFRTSTHLCQEDDFYFSFSFSLLHSTEKTIDVTCLNCFDFEGWVLGLSAILDLTPQWGKPLYSIGSPDTISLLNEQEKALCQSSHISVQAYLFIKNHVERLKSQNLPEITRGQMRVLSQLDIIRSDRIYAYLYRPVYSSKEDQSPIT